MLLRSFLPTREKERDLKITSAHRQPWTSVCVSTPSFPDVPFQAAFILIPQSKRLPTPWKLASAKYQSLLANTALWK